MWYQLPSIILTIFLDYDTVALCSSIQLMLENRFFAIINYFGVQVIISEHVTGLRLLEIPDEKSCLHFSFVVNIGSGYFFKVIANL